MKIRELAKRNGTITHFPIQSVNSTAPGAPIFATPIENGKASNSLLAPSKTTFSTAAISIKKRKRRSDSLSDSEEGELTDESDFNKVPEDVSEIFTTPSKSINKRRFRPVPPKTYADEGDGEFGGVSDDDDVDFDPDADLKEEKRKSRRRRGIVDDFSDDY
jgi:hypothetical protein